MTLEEELLFYIKRASDLFAANSEYIRDPDFKDRYKEMRETMDILLEVIESKKKGEHKYDHIDYNSIDMLELKEKLKEIAEGFDKISGMFNQDNN